jgi:hypothetical protein
VSLVGGFTQQQRLPRVEIVVRDSGEIHLRHVPGKVVKLVGKPFGVR